MAPRETPEAFLYRSFRILDAGDFDGWLALCAEDISYTVTTVTNVERNYPVAIIQDDFNRLKGRVQSIVRFWHAETPRTRLLHMLTNIEIEPDGADATTVHSCFLLTATRRDRQVMLIGRYRDSLVARDGAWKLRSRLAVLEDDMIAGGKITFIV